MRDHRPSLFALALLTPACLGGFPVGTPPGEDPDALCSGATPSSDGYSLQFSPNGCVEYQPGTLPLVISMPHGGYLLPAELPDRTEGTTVNDGVTQELGREVADAIEARTGKRPALIINRLDRVKLDPNREIGEGAGGAPETEAEWQAYHGFVESAEAEIKTRGGIGLYVDLHGQSHDPGRTQLGFSTTSDDLKRSDSALDSGSYDKASSLIPHVETSAAPFSEILRGATSLGGMMGARGYSAVPSPGSPSPEAGITYWNTGYSSYEHGPLRSAPWMSSVLFETAYDGIRDTRRNRLAFADHLAEILIAFQAEHDPG